MYKIEKGIPFTPRQKYPLADMEIGDSFVFPISIRNSVTNSAMGFGKRRGRKFTVRKISDTEARIHRTK